MFQALKAATDQLEETCRGVRAELQGSQAAERHPGVSWRFFGWMFWESLGWKSYFWEKKEVETSIRFTFYASFRVDGFGRSWWWKLECCRLMKAAGDSLGTCFCHGNTMLRRRGLSLERFACFTTQLHGDYIEPHWGLLLSKIYPAQWNVTTVSDTAHPAWMPCTRLGTCHAAAEGAPTGSSRLKDSRGNPIW